MSQLVSFNIAISKEKSPANSKQGKQQQNTGDVHRSSARMMRIRT
jgi:hypothetical protein